MDLLRRHMTGDFADIKTIVETGTCRGVGTQVMAKNFEQVYTIELDETLHAQTKERLHGEGLKNITFIQGDSSVRLAQLIPELDGPAVFFLDAHWSGDASVDWESSKWKGYRFDTAHAGDNEVPTSQEQVPLGEEFEAIARLFPYRGVIYVDDMDKFDWLGRGTKDKCFKGEDWSHLSVSILRDALGERVETWKRIRNQLIVRVAPAS